MLTLYYAPNTCALATHIALEEAGLAYKLECIDFRTEAQRSPAFLGVNPKGRVPVLTSNGRSLTETPALLVYVAQLAEAVTLAPSDSYEFARMQAFNAYLCSTVHVAHAHRMRGHRWVDEPTAIEAMQRKVPQSVTSAFLVIENELEGPWVMGDQYTVADGYLFTLAQWLEADGADLGKLPRVLDHRRRMVERPAVQRATEQELG